MEKPIIHHGISFQVTKPFKILKQAWQFKTIFEFINHVRRTECVISFGLFIQSYSQIYYTIVKRRFTNSA